MSPVRRWLRHIGYDWDDSLLFAVIVLALAVVACSIFTGK